MYRLKLYESWKTGESEEKDKDNIAELNDFLLDMKDELDNFEYKIDIDNYIEDSYNIKYQVVCGLGFSVWNNEDLDDLIKTDKDNLELLNRYMNQSYQLIERLKRTNYKIAYFSVDNTWNGNDKIIAYNIRIKKVDYETS